MNVCSPSASSLISMVAPHAKFPHTLINLEHILASPRIINFFSLFPIEMKAALLHIPIKKTEEINWVKPLKKYLLSVYGDTSEFQGDLERLDSLRQSIRDAHSDEVGISMYMRYFSYLELLDLRVPMDVVNKHKSLKFTWSDAFSPSSTHEQSALPFEKASVLFNLGALMTRASSATYSVSQRSSGGDEASFKLALNLMLQAAGVFKFLSENFLHGPSNDSKPATVNFLVNLCLAQNQEMFNLKVIDGDLEQKKNSLIAKLCASTATYYEDCYKVVGHLSTPEGSASVSNHSTFSLEDGSINDLSFDDETDVEYNPDRNDLPDDKVYAELDAFWISTIQVKALYYKSLSYYFQALHLESTSKYGDTIAYLTRSSDILNEISSASLKAISKTGGEQAYELLDNYKYQKDAVEIKLKDLVKDNDLIYHDIIPNAATLAEPKPMNSAKAIPISSIEAFSKINEHSYTNFLCKVVPINVHELLSYYSEEKSQLLRAELDENDVAAEKLASALESLKLPKALVAIKELIVSEEDLKAIEREISLPPETLGQVSDIANSYSADARYRDEIRRKRDDIYKMINNCQKNIDVIQFSNSSAKYREDLIKLKKALFDAANSDSRLFELVDGENHQLHLILGGGVNSDEFKGLFSAKTTTATSKVDISNEISLLDIDDRQTTPLNAPIDGQIKKIEDILNDLNILKSERQKLVAALKEDIHKDDISDIIMLNSKVKSTNEIKTEIFQDELKKFDQYLKKLDVLVNKQDTLIIELQSLWQSLSQNPKVKEVQMLSQFKSNLVEEQVHRINSFYNNWRKYTIGLKRGTEIYEQLYKFSEGLNSAIEMEAGRTSMADSFSSLRIDRDSRGNSFELQPHAAQPGISGQAPAIPPRIPGIADRDQRNYNLSGQPSYGEGAVQPHYPGPQSSTNQNSTNGASKGSRDREGGLIYDQPSAYQPHMYNFFLKNT